LLNILDIGYWILFFSEVRRTNPKHPPKTAIQELRKTTSPTFARSFARSVCGKLFCSISPKICPEYYSKHPPKLANQELRKMASQLSRPSFAFFCVFIKPQHNALILLKLKIKHQSIKVRSRKWRMRTPKK